MVSTIVEPPPPLFYGHSQPTDLPYHPCCHSNRYCSWICSFLIGGGYMVHRMLWCTIIVDRRGSTETSAPRPSIFTSDSLPSCTINSRLREPLYPSSSTTHQGTRYLRKPNPRMMKSWVWLSSFFSIHPRARWRLDACGFVRVGGAEHAGYICSIVGSSVYHMILGSGGEKVCKWVSYIQVEPYYIHSTCTVLLNNVLICILQRRSYNQQSRMDWGTIIWIHKQNNNIWYRGQRMIFVWIYPLFFNMCGGTGTKAYPKKHIMK